MSCQRISISESVNRFFVHFGLAAIRDENAAINILALGQSVLAQTQTIRL